MATPVATIPLTNDFQPPVGKPSPAAPRESPGEFRLLTATSSDGRTFKATGRVILDQANVPDLIMGDHNLLYLYFTGWQLGDKRNVTAVALSPDFGQTWYFKHLTFTGFVPETATPNDPDIVRLPDGTFRLYGTTSLDRQTQKLGIVSMDSSDGLHFGKPTPAFTLNTNVIDSTTFLFKNMWRMFVLDSDKPEQWHATSPTGNTFALLEKTRFNVAGAAYIVSNGVALNDGYRLYGFSIPQKNFRSFFSTDGVSWVADTGVPLAFDPTSKVESQYIKDPAMVRLPNGSYLMVYVSKLP